MLIDSLLFNSGFTKIAVNDELLERIKQRDMGAFHELYETTRNSVYGFALSILNNTHDAEDVLQDTFLTVFKSVETYTPVGKPMAWIFTITRNHCMMRLRAKKDLLSEYEENSENEEALSRIETTENRMLIEWLMSLLDSEERQVVILHSVSGLKIKEISELLSLPLNTVLSKHHRAIKKLQSKAKSEGIIK